MEPDSNVLVLFLAVHLYINKAFKLTSRAGPRAVKETIQVPSRRREEWSKVVTYRMDSINAKELRSNYK